jgi:hypothetical protein
MCLVRSYVEAVQSWLQNESVRLEAEFTSKLPTLSEDEAHDAYAWYVGDESNLKEEFPALCHSSTLIATFSFLEHHLAIICEQVRQAKGHTLAVGDVAGKGIEQSRTYLTKVLGFNDPATQPEWCEIKSLQKARNRLVHSLGHLDPYMRGEHEKHAELRKYILARGGKVDRFHRIIVTPELCLHAVEVIRAFLKKLMPARNAAVGGGD